MHSLFAKNCVTHTFHSGEVRRGLERFVEGAPEGGGESSIQAVLHAIAEVAEAECADWKLFDAADKKAHKEEQALSRPMSSRSWPSSWVSRPPSPKSECMLACLEDCLLVGLGGWGWGWGWCGSHALRVA